MDDAYSPKLVAPQCGLKEEQILSLAEDIASTAFNKAINIDQDWVDFRGEKDLVLSVDLPRHERYFSTLHGFQTCRAIHLLQIIIGSVDVPGGFDLSLHTQNRLELTQNHILNLVPIAN